jgi:2-oxoglutarate dehydrogenase complex dehydrogenase (E1) component-like enzyme
MGGQKIISYEQTATGVLKRLFADQMVESLIAKRIAVSDMAKERADAENAKAQGAAYYGSSEYQALGKAEEALRQLIGTNDFEWQQIVQNIDAAAMSKDFNQVPDSIRQKRALCAFPANRQRGPGQLGKCNVPGAG